MNKRTPSNMVGVEPYVCIYLSLIHAETNELTLCTQLTYKQGVPDNVPTINESGNTRDSKKIKRVTFLNYLCS